MTERPPEREGGRGRGREKERERERINLCACVFRVFSNTFSYK